MTKILVTGYTGFIGSRLSQILIGHGEKIKGISSRVINSDKDIIVCDLITDELKESYFEGVSVVIHLAGYAHDTEYGGNKISLCQLLNVDSTIKLAKFAEKMNIEKFIFVSSVKAGSPNINNYSDYINSKPRGIYGSSKKRAEEALQSIFSDSNMKIDIIRPALVYGPNMKGNLAAMYAAIEKGWFPPLPLINNRRSMVHLDNLVNSIVEIMRKSNKKGEIYVITDNREYSSREIFEIFCEMSNRKIPKWTLPLFVFNLASIFSSSLKEKFNKLFGDEYYAGTSYVDIGYEPKLSLKDINNGIKLKDK